MGIFGSNVAGLLTDGIDEMKTTLWMLDAIETPTTRL